MIDASDNNAANAVGNSSRGSNGLRITDDKAGLTDTAFQVGHGWGFSITTAHDQAKLEAALAAGRILTPAHTQSVLSLMRNVEVTQRWGFADSVDPTLRPAVKNGWYEDSDVPVWRVHCTAIFDLPTLAASASRGSPAPAVLDRRREALC